MSTKFYICEKCGNIVEIIQDSRVTPVCCRQKMTEFIARTVVPCRGKHVPVVSVSENCAQVVVGSVLHPMAEEHNISWVYLETDKGGARKQLNPGDEPRVVFALADEKPQAVYAYCNLHGLWKTEI